jgi:hypothetical protein
MTLNNPNDTMVAATRCSDEFGKWNEEKWVARDCCGQEGPSIISRAKTRRPNWTSP